MLRVDATVRRRNAPLPCALINGGKQLCRRSEFVAMGATLGRAVILAFVFWSWVPVVTLGLTFAQPISLQMSGDAILMIDRSGSDDSRVASARLSDFRIGDHFAASALPLEGRLLLYGYAPARPSDRLALNVSRDRERHTVTLRPRQYNVFNGLQPVAIALATLVVVLNALTITAAGALAIARPGVLTRSIFFALFGLLVGTVDLRPIRVSGLTVFLVLTCGYGFGGFCAWESVRAANHFPDGAPGPRSHVLLWSAGLIATFAGCWAMFRNSAGVLYPIGATPDWLVSDSPSSPARALYFSAIIALNILTALALALRYRRSLPEDQLKLRALLIALAAYAAVSAFSSLVTWLVPFHHGITALDEVVAWSELVVYLIPITIIAAILRHRLFGLRFVVDRALVYGGLALLLVAPLRLVNVVLAARFPHTRVATVAEVVVAVGLAVAIEPLRRGIERLLRSTIFRKQQHALARLSELRVAAGSATTTTELSLLVKSAAHVLDLAGATLVLADDNLETATSEILTDPALDIGLYFGRREVGRLIFGPHRTGADLDPEEGRALRSFAAEIERAAERFTADRLQSEIAELQARLAESRGV